MTTTWALPALAAAAVLSLTACAGSTQAAPEPAVTTTVTATATPEPAVTESSEPVNLSPELAVAVMEQTWSEMTYTDKEDVCFGWNLDSAWALDLLMEESEDLISREDAKAFFDEKCGGF